MKIIQMFEVEEPIYYIGGNNMCYHVDDEIRLMKLRWLVNILFIEEITEHELEAGYNNIYKGDEDETNEDR